jgi:hypothetical protein
MGSLIDDVTPRRVRALLVNREPALLATADANHDLFTETVAGIAAEVVPIVGVDPAPGPIRDLAVWAITLGTAASLETGLYPEQQLGEDARARELRVRYLGVLSQLRARAGGGTNPRGTFPKAQAWPDPARTW